MNTHTEISNTVNTLLARDVYLEYYLKEGVILRFRV